MTYETIDILVIEKTKYKVNWFYIRRKLISLNKYLKFYERVLNGLKNGILKFYKNFLLGVKYGR